MPLACWTGHGLVMLILLSLVHIVNLVTRTYFALISFINSDWAHFPCLICRLLLIKLVIVRVTVCTRDWSCFHLLPKFDLPSAVCVREPLKADFDDDLAGHCIYIWRWSERLHPGTEHLWCLCSIVVMVTSTSCDVSLFVSFRGLVAKHRTPLHV